MFPIVLDLTKIPIFLTGQGELLAKRCRMLEEYGAAQFVDTIEKAAVVMIAGLPRLQAQEMVAHAHALGKLVNVEDINDLCDFYFTANVRRGDLIIAVSTSGASPTLARKIRDVIAKQFGEEWALRLSEILQLRKAWKAQGKDMKEVVECSERHLAGKKWLVSSPSPALAGEGRGGGEPGTAGASGFPSLTLPHQGGGDKKVDAA